MAQVERGFVTALEQGGFSSGFAKSAFLLLKMTFLAGLFYLVV